MVNKNKIGFLKAACLMLAVTMIAACVLSGTMAKYTSSGTVSGLTLTIAKWDVNVEDNDLNGEEIDLSTLEWVINPIDDIPPPADQKAAPGTWGYAQITVENLSEVDAVIKVSGAEDIGSMTADSDGLTFKVDPNSSSYEEIGTEITAEGVAIAMSNSVYIYVCYQWEFGDGTNDTKDTAMGESPTDITFGDLTITAEQSDGSVT